MAGRFRAALTAMLGPMPQPPSIDNPRWWSGLGVAPAMTVAGVCATPERCLQLDVVQACLDNLAGPASSLQIGLFEIDDNGDRELVTDHDLARLLRRPNARQTAQEFFDELLRHLGYWRNGYAVYVFKGEDIVGLDLIHPKRKQKIERKGDGRVYYTFTVPGKAETVTYRDDEIWHVRKAPLTDDGLEGRPMWETGAEVFGRAIAVKDFGSRYFVNNAGTGGILKHPGNFKSKEDEQDFLESWRASGAGANAHRDRLLKMGVDYKPGEATAEAAQFNETIREENVAIARLWNMPPHRVGILDRATFSNIEQQSIEYVTYTLAPWFELIEQAIERDFLLTDDDRERYCVEFNVADLLRGDIKSMYMAFYQGRQGGWLSINDVRRALHLNSIGPTGDVYSEPLNMKPAGSKAAPADDAAEEDTEPGDKKDSTDV